MLNYNSISFLGMGTLINGINKISRDKMMNNNRRVLENKLHKVVIIGNSHTRECAYVVRQLLHNNYEVLGFINPGSGMKFIHDTTRMNIQQLTKKAVVMLWCGPNNVARNNSVECMKHILDFIRNSNHSM
jgi:hypothetical protein